MAASGDFRELRALRARLTGFGGSGFWLTMSRALAETARERIKVSFQESQDPYEKPWKASWHRRGPDKGSFKTLGQILRDTNRLFRSLVPSEINREGFRVSTAVKYAAIHNWGGTITLPYQERVLAHQKNGRFMRRSKAQRAKKSVRVSFAKYGARFVVRGGPFEVGAGTARERNVVIEFPSYEAAMECLRSPEYAEAAAFRDRGAHVDLIVIGGYEGPQPGEA